MLLSIASYEFQDSIGVAYNGDMFKGLRKKGFLVLNECFIILFIDFHCVLAVLHHLKFETVDTEHGGTLLDLSSLRIIIAAMSRTHQILFIYHFFIQFAASITTLIYKTTDLVFFITDLQILHK